MSLESHDDLADAIDFYNNMSRRQNGNIIFVDPSTGEQISADHPPAYLMQDKKLKDGYDFLQTFGHLINIEFILAAHDPRDDSSLGDRSFGYEQRVHLQGSCD